MRRLLSLLGILLVVGLFSPVGAGHAAGGGSGGNGGSSTAARCSAWSGTSLSADSRKAIRSARNAVDDVFEGRVALPSKAPSKGALRLRVHVLATWKGATQPQTTVTVTFRAGPCRTWTLAHPVHEEYVFFANRTPTGGLAAAGSAPRVVAHTAPLIEVLGPATGGTQPTQPVTFTLTGATPPRPFLKVAAPGIALLIIGLLGLLVVTRLGRRTA